MSFLGGMLGGGSGMGWQAGSANMTNAVTKQQADEAYKQTQSALGQQAGLSADYLKQNAIQNQANVFNQQQELANQLQAGALGQGPNPALQQLANSTGANVAQQGALLAGQRGASANAGLMGRQAGRLGMEAQQQAVGQAAALQAQQQLAQQQLLAQQQGAMGTTAAQQVSGQQGAVTNYNNFAQNQQQQLLNAINQQNQNAVQMQSNMNTTNQAQQAQNAKGQGQLMGMLGTAAQLGLGAMTGGASLAAGPMLGQVGGMLGGGGSSMGMLSGDIMQKAHGGIISRYADGGQVAGPMSYAAKFLSGQAMNASNGAMVPGHASVQGDSLKNDVVPAMLSPGEIVIPRSVAQGADAPNKAAKFVAAVLAKGGRV